VSTELDEAGRSFYKGPGDAYRVRVEYEDDLPSLAYDASGHDVYMAVHGVLHDIIRQPAERVIKTFTVERAPETEAAE
jgi:hypothetical protein